VRVDSGLEAGGEVTPLYDPMVAKLIVWDVDRASATKRMLRALGEYRIEPLTTLIPFHQAVMASDDWADASTFRDKIGDKKWLKELMPAGSSASRPGPSGSEEGSGEETVERTYQVEVNGRLHSVKVIGAAASGGNSAGPAAKRPPKRERSAGGGGSGAGGPELTSPLQGTIFKVAVEKGQEVATGDLICVIEAMKMENEITAHVDGKVADIKVAEGASVNPGDVLAVIE
jgi:acetyl-CoA/propionyl-CoA carboxylase, biotin carboxylase, biotin carboxyl carrier protein